MIKYKPPHISTVGNFRPIPIRL